MTSDLVKPARPGALALADPELAERSRQNRKKPLSSGAKRAYAHDWRRFQAFCRGLGLVAMPTDEETIGAHLTQLAATGEFKLGTLRRIYASIRAMHTHAGVPLPRLFGVENTLANLGRQLGGKTRQAAAFELEDLRRFVDRWRGDLAGLRDRALVLLGFAGAFRRSELVALDVADLDFVSKGLRVVIRKSKTDQAGVGQAIGINLGEGAVCPVAAVQTWLAASGLREGPAFVSIHRTKGLTGKRLSDRYIDTLAKSVAGVAGRDASRYSGHSFRAGLATAAAEQGKDLIDIMQTTRHRSERVARGYIREGELFTRAANRGLMK